MLGAIERQVLTTAVVAATIDKAFAMLTEQRRQAPVRSAGIETEIRRLRRELDNRLQLVADGRAPQSVLTEITKRETQIENLEQQLATHRPEAPTAQELRRIKRDLREHLGGFATCSIVT